MHTLRKYISNRGSALFMVISIMTALMITCMAMYFTVVSSRSTTYAIFNEKQSYQNAISIYNMIMNNAQSDTPLRAKIDSMKTVGETITSKGNDQLLGDYVVTITRLQDQMEDGNMCKFFDVIVTTTYKGVSETIHSQIYYPPPEKILDPNPNSNVALSPTFAATGYVPNDVYLDMGHFYSDVYFDNEVTYLGAYSGSELFAEGNINCAGSVVIRNGKAWKTASNKPMTFSVRNMLTIEGGNPMDMKEGDKILVGGDFHLGREIKNADIYVNGDLYLSTNLQQSSVYVNGDIILERSGLNISDKICCNGKVINPKNANLTIASDGAWNARAEDNSDIMDVDTMISDLDRKTSTNPYYKWTIDETEVPEVKENGGNHQSIVTSSINYEPVYIVHENAYTSTDTVVPYAGYNDEENDKKWRSGCIIDNITVNSDFYYYMIIDTGDNPDNVYTIRVKANRTGPDKKKNLFSWTGEKGDSVRPIILVKGRGSVVIDVPEGVIYQDTNYAILCHYNWWVLCGAPVPSDITNTGDRAPETRLLDAATLAKYIHSVCGKSGDSCVFEVIKNEGEKEPERCTRMVLKTTGEAPCGKIKQTVKCTAHSVDSNHDGDYDDPEDYLCQETFCPDCELHLVQNENGSYNICKDRVDRAAVNSTYQTASNKSKWNTARNGSLIYPNCNIFLISSAESADFRFGRKPDNTEITMNSMVGYVYAPYVTFYAAGGDQGNTAVKYMGGMTVSDHNFYSAASFLMCIPDRSPADLMGDNCTKNTYTVVKSWKIKLKTH